MKSVDKKITKKTRKKKPFQIIRNIKFFSTHNDTFKIEMCV